MNRVILWGLMVILCIVFLMGCRHNDANAIYLEEFKSEPLDEFTDLFNDTDGGHLIGKTYYDQLTQDELKIVSVTEGDSVYCAYPQSPISKEELDSYGVDRYFSFGDLYKLYCLDDFRLLFSNQEFRDFYYQKYGTEVDTYRLIRSFEEDVCAIDFFILDGQYRCTIKGRKYSENGEHLLRSWAVFEHPNVASIDEVANYYTKDGGYKLAVSKREDGKEIYHFAGNEKNRLCYWLAVKNGTVYMWEEENTLGVLVLPGDYDEENLKMCCIEKYDVGEIVDM